MKGLLTLTRWIVGLLFIFSGLIKANDPLGLSYKMQEFFEAWGWHFLDNYTLLFALIMNVFEVLAGVAVIVGWRMKLFSWLLLLLIIFFTFLTGYAVLTDKIKTCGCFGDCIPLTPVQSFLKDLALLLLIILLFLNRRIIKPLFRPVLPQIILLVSIISISVLQAYALKHLPLLDCLPYKAGRNIPEQMKIPAGALADSFVTTFKYSKNGKTVEYNINNLPDDLDSTYELVDRFDKKVRAGNATPAIVDFSLQTISGTDTTLALLNQPGFYTLVFIQDFNSWSTQKDNVHKLIDACAQKKIPVFIVSSFAEEAKNIFSNKPVTIIRCDGTVIRTAARVNSTYFLMQQGNILAKKSYADTEKFIDKMNNITAAHNR